MKVLDGTSGSLYQSLASWSRLKDGHIRIMSPFLTIGAADHVAKLILQVTKNGGTVDVLVGVKHAFTSPEALALLSKISEQEERVTVRTDFNLPASQRFHAKLYLAEWTSGRCDAITGSANLTESGLEGLGELGLLHKLGSETRTWNELLAFFNGWFTKAEDVTKTLKDYTVDAWTAPPRPPEPSRDRDLIQRVRNGAVKFAYRESDWTDEDHVCFKALQEKYERLGRPLPSESLDDYIGATAEAYRLDDTVAYIWKDRKPDKWIFDFYTVGSHPLPLEPSSRDTEFLVLLVTSADPGPGYRRKPNTTRLRLLRDELRKDRSFKKRVADEAKSELPPPDVERLFDMAFRPTKA